MVPVSQERGYRPGISMNLETVDEHGEPWDFDSPQKRAQARKWIEKPSDFGHRVPDVRDVFEIEPQSLKDG